MRHLAAYLLLVAGGNSQPTADDITNLLGKVGIDSDNERLSQLISDLEGKDLKELVDSGKDMLYKGGMAVAGAAAPAAGGNAEASGDAPKKEEPKVEEVDALEGGMDIFGGGGGGDY